MALRQSSDLPGKSSPLTQVLQKQLEVLSKSMGMEVAQLQRMVVSDRDGLLKAVTQQWQSNEVLRKQYANPRELTNQLSSLSEQLTILEQTARGKEKFVESTSGKGLFGRAMDTTVSVIAWPFKKAWSVLKWMGKNPVKTVGIAALLAAAAYFGAPYFFKAVAEMEGLASKPGLEWLHRWVQAAKPLSPGLSPVRNGGSALGGLYGAPGSL